MRKEYLTLGYQNTSGEGGAFYLFHEVKYILLVVYYGFLGIGICSRL